MAFGKHGCSSNGAVTRQLPVDTGAQLEAKRALRQCLRVSGQLQVSFSERAALPMTCWPASTHGHGPTQDTGKREAFVFSTVE